MAVRGPLLGHNQNVAHRGKVLHVQTEDLGPRRNAVVTHLFVDGGRIVHSERFSYAEHAESPDVESVIRAAMLSQHRELIERVLAGAFDAELSLEVDAAPISLGPRPSGPPASSRPAERLTIGPGIGALVPVERPSTEPPAPSSLAPTERQGGAPIMGRASPERTPIFGERFDDGTPLATAMAAFLVARAARAGGAGVPT